MRDGVGLAPIGCALVLEGVGLTRGGAATTRTAGWVPSSLSDSEASIGEPSMVAASISCPTSGTHCEGQEEGRAGSG